MGLQPLYGTVWQHLACCPQPQGSSEELWQCPSIPGFHNEMGMLGQAQGREAGCDGLPAWTWVQVLMRWDACLGKQLEVVCQPWMQHEGVSPLGPGLSPPGGFIGALYHISASGVIFYIPYLQEGVSPASTLRGSPKHILLTRLEGWRGIRGIWRCYRSPEQRICCSGGFFFPAINGNVFIR